MNGGELELHELSDDALVHWDRDGLGDLKEFQLIKTSWFKRGMTDSRYWLWWDYVCWVPSYERFTYADPRTTVFIHYPHGWIEDRSVTSNGKSQVRMIWIFSQAIASLNNPYEEEIKT